jgi:twinkle protein
VAHFLKIEGQMLTDDHAQWFEARGLDVEVATRIGIESRGEAIAFPYKRGGQLISYKFRHFDKSMSFDRKGAPVVLFDLECIENLSSNPDECLVVTEGEPDAVAVLQSGFQFVVSVPTGANGKRTEETTPADKDTAYSYLWQDGRPLPELKPFRKIVLAVDGDEKGQILRDELALRLGRSRCFWVKYPRGSKDPNDVLKAHGVHGVRDLVEQATPLAPAATVSLMDLPPRPIRVAFSTGMGGPRSESQALQVRVLCRYRHSKPRQKPVGARACIPFSGKSRMEGVLLRF